MANRIIHLNQLGYRCNTTKRAVIEKVEGHFRIIENSSGKVVLEGEIEKGVDQDPASGDDVRWMDFSSLNREGKYRLELLPDLFRSLPFVIGSNPYAKLKNGLLKGLYYQRCGCELEEKHAGPWKHSACHTQPAVLHEKPEVKLDITGGWHDAGDYGKYVVPGAITVAMMLLAYERFPRVFGEPVGIPESGNGIPDILNEARFELEWLMKMQAPDGGVYHKTTTRRFAGTVMPEEDSDPWVVSGVSVTATADFAAVAAMASRVYEAFDPVFAEEMMDAAVKGWQWLEQNQENKGFKNPPDIMTGDYGDMDTRDERVWAACALYRATRQSAYAVKVKEMLALWPDVDKVEFDWRRVGGFASMEILFMKDGDPLLADTLKKAFLAEAARLGEIAGKDGYGIPMLPTDYFWGSNMVLANRGVHLVLASMLEENKQWEEAAQNTLNWLLGCNPMGVCYVTGFGAYPIRFPHHRPSEADDVDEPVPGLVSGGPNISRQDPIAKVMVGKEQYPARCFIDDSGSYSTNEIAIYWNTPVLFLAAWQDS